jgi:hypothetical protein
MVNWAPDLSPCPAYPRPHGEVGGLHAVHTHPFIYIDEIGMCIDDPFPLLHNVTFASLYIALR